MRTWSRAFLQYKNFQQSPWMNCKGSDSMLCCQWLVTQSTGFLNDLANNGADQEALSLIKSTSEAFSVSIFAFLNSHGLFYDKACAMTFYARLTRYINGHNLLANRMANQNWKLWAIKPKLHLAKHFAYENHSLLQARRPLFLNENSRNCEQNEDLVGRVSRLSRRMDIRHGLPSSIAECFTERVDPS